MKEMILELLQQKRNILVVILLLLVLTIALNVVENSYLEPAVQTASKRYDELQRQRAAEGALDIPALYRKGRTDLQTLATRIPMKRHFPQQLGDILDLASSNSLKVGRASYKPQILKEENLMTYSLSLSLQGSYAAVKSYLADIQSKPELIIIEQVSFANQDLYEEAVTMDLRLIVYLKNQEGV